MPSFVQMIVAAAALAVASGFSAWMFISSLGTGGLPGCGEGSACNAVSSSRWSRWAKIPVSALGAFVYLSMLGLIIFRQFSLPRSWLVASNFVLESLTLMTIGAAVWFVGLQFLLIRRLCAYCITIQVCGTTAALIILSTDLSWNGPHYRSGPPFLAIVGLLLLVGGQLLFKPKTYAVVASSDSVEEQAPLDLPAEPVKFQARPRIATHRRVSFRSGRVVLNMDGFPVFGPQNAEYVVAWLFDHTCLECHHLHRLLLEAIDHYQGRLAVLAISVPLNPSCNPAIKCIQQERAYSCAFARLDWAMWTVDLAMHEKWSRFMSEEEQPKPFGLAMLKAKELADISRFHLREEDPELDKRIALAVRVFIAAGKPKIPALLLPGGILLGHVPTVKALIELLDANLKPNAVTKPSATVSS